MLGTGSETYFCPPVGTGSETYFCTANTSFFFPGSSFRLFTVWKRDIRKKNYFPGHFDGVVQLLFGIGPANVNYLLNGVRK